MFGSKPAGFGTAFGAGTTSTPGFGTAGYQSSPPAGGLFGQQNTSTTGDTAGGLFGGGGSGTAFGAQSTGFSFGATPTASTGLFGQKTTASTGLFGTPAASSSNAFAFGTAGSNPGFGTTTSTSTGGGLFGTGSTPAAGGLFGTSTGFGQQQAQNGTTIKFSPPQGQDKINTKHQCITAMKEYETKSLEELRVEDYTANRKGKQSGTTGFGFGTPVVATTQAGACFAFGQNKTAFGASTPTLGFGTAGYQSTPTAGGSFGQQNTSTTGGTAGGLFGGGGSGTAFGAQSTGFSFGATPTASTGLFGQKTTASTGLFGTPAASSSNAFAFGTAGSNPGFGTTTSTSTGGGLFGTGSTPAAGGLFGTSTGFGQQQAQNGTTIKFSPLQGQDTMVKNGVTATINTKHQCITAMKEYETKSLEELRVEDYTANRKGKQAGTTGFGFGTPVVATTQAGAGFAFGQNKTAFGASTGFGSGTSTGATNLFGQQQASQASTGLFGQSKPLFGTAATTQSGFGFGTSTSTGTGSLFGQQQANKPLFGTTTTQPSSFGTSGTTFGQPAASSGFTGFGASQAGGLLASKPPAFGTQTTASTGGFSFAQPANNQSNLFAKPFSAPATGLFNTATTSAGFGATQPFVFGGLFTSAPAFNFGGGAGLPKPALAGNSLTATDNTVQLQQTLLALTHSPYGDSQLFWNMKESSTKREEVLKPTNPAAQKAVLANQHKVSPGPVAKIKPKALHGVLNGSKSKIFEGLEDDDFSFGNDTFMPRKSVKKLILKKSGLDSGTPSRGTSLSGEPPNVSSLRDEEQFRGRASSEVFADNRHDEPIPDIPETENIIRSKGIPEHMSDTPNRGTNMDDTIAMLNARNQAPPPLQQEPMTSRQSQDDTVNISIISRDESNADDSIMDERPMTPPPPHPAGIVLARPGYYTIPGLDALGEMVDEGGDCSVEDLTIGCEGYGSIFFPGMTNLSNLNLDEIVFFRHKEVIVYPDDDNKPPVGEGLNKKAEITLDCVWPRDKSIGTPIKSPEKLMAMRWQDKIEENSLKVGAKFIDYRPETGSWVFEVKHFSKYGLLDDSDDEDVSEQEKKRLRTAQTQQVAVQKQKLHMEQLEKQQLLKTKSGLNGHSNGQMAKFTIGTDDDESEGSLAARNEVPMGDDDNPMSDASPAQMREDMRDFDNDYDDMEMREEPPSSHRLATSMGVDARNMQVMKTSFFSDEEAPISGLGGQLFTKKPTLEAGSPLLRQAEKSGPSLFSSALRSKYMSPVKLSNLPQVEKTKDRAMFSPRLITPEPIRALTHQTFHPPVKECMLLASGMTPQDYQKKVVVSRVSRDIPNVKESYQYQKQSLLVDAGLFMGRSFRVGWGPGWTLAHSGDVVQPKDSDEERPANTFNLFSGPQSRPSGAGNSNWKVHLQKLNIADHINPHDKTVVQNHREMLEIQLVHSRSAREGDCPVFTPTLGVEALHQYAERNQDELENLSSHPDEASVKHMGMVWDLCVALWGNLPEFKDIDVSRDSYMYHNARREAFSRWLSMVSGDVIRKEVQENKYKEQGHLQGVLSSLTGRQITEACQLAQKSGDHKLALLLAQAVSNYIPRQMLCKQLEEWSELGVDNFITETRLKIYSLLSGRLVLSSQNLTVNTCEGLDWKCSLGLHLWFHCQADAPIQEAVDIYEGAFKGGVDYQAYTCPPLPLYMETGEMEMLEPGQEETSIRDTCYHLLCLYCQKCHQLEQILSPVTSTSSQLDYRISWHLSQVLQSLSYHHLSSYHRASLHMNFAAHLESLNLWEWAVFVALHIQNPVSRENAVRSILNRHIQLSTSDTYVEKEELLREQLLVPESWIHHAKALRAHYENQPKEEAWHLLKAGHWNRSHDIVLRHIAPEAVIHDDIGNLQQYLTELSHPDRSCTILDWHIGGKVYLDYINICQSMEQLPKAGEPSPYQLDRLLPEVKSLCTKVGSIPCRNSKDRLCQSEMAKRSANFLRLILTLQSEARGETQPPMRLLAPYISNLPMPEDYALHELRTLTRSFMMEQTVG